MISKYIYGEPFETEAVLQKFPAEEGDPAYGRVNLECGFEYTYVMTDSTKVFGLGENVRGINKRGFRYVSFATDTPHHYEDTQSLYGAHNFILVSGQEMFGLFVDYPGELSFDIGYTEKDILKISCKKADLKLFVIDGGSAYDIVKQFRIAIGRSYIPPKFAFGFGQSRWGYKTEEDFREVVRRHREAGVPLDMVYMDIDYMDGYRDFTVNEKEFPDFAGFVEEMREDHIHLVPIIDAGVKIDKDEDMDPAEPHDNSVYKEGTEKNYFCKRADGSDFVTAVWPGYTHLPDVLNPEARAWFGGKYSFLTEKGIDAFWNDMNEPALFFSPEGIEKIKARMREALESGDEKEIDMLGWQFEGLKNSRDDYAAFYHNVNGRMVCHEDVHNLFGYNMTRAAGEAFEKLRPGKRTLMFSRSSYVGMHRYGGIWMGDNLSWWSHLLMNLKMLPSLNMVGLLYIGADLGGFGSDTSRDLVLRWLALGVFTPLMRNHSAAGTRRQEFYQFEESADFRSVVRVKYRLLPYIYSEFMKAALNNDMMFKPLAFEYPDDLQAVETEDQMLIGNEVMIAPVCTQNASGRVVYLPEEMMFVCFRADGSIYTEVMEKGLHYIRAALSEVPMFIRKGKTVPIAAGAEYVDAVDYGTIEMYGFEGASYTLYNDDGIGLDYDPEKNCRILKR